MNDKLKDLTVVKRSGQRVSFNSTKIAIAIKRAFDSVYEEYNEKDINKIYEKIVKKIENEYKDRKTINVEDIQDMIENQLEEEKYIKVYSSFKEYRLRRAASREAFQIKQQHKFVKAIEKVGYQASEVNDKKPNELIEKYAKTISKEFALSYLLENKIIRALDEGSIYLNDLKTFSLGNTSSSHIDLSYIEEDNINEYFNKIINLIIMVKKDQYKEHTLMNFDTNLKNKIIKEYKKNFYEEILNYTEINGIKEFLDLDKLNNDINNIQSLEDKKIINNLKNDVIKNIYTKAYEKSINKIKVILTENFKKMFEILEIAIPNEYQKLIISLDNNDTYENNLIITTYFKTLIKSKKIITNIFINNNYDTTTKIIEKIKDGYKFNLILHNNRDITYFSSGEEIYANINDSTLTSKGRTLNSECTINLARIALNSKTKKEFFQELDYVIDITKNALLSRYELQANKYKNNFNVLFDTNLLFDSEKLEEHQKIRKIIRNGVFFIGYTSLIEAVLILNDKNKLEEKDYDLAFEIVKYIKDRCNNLTNDLRLNFLVKETYNEEILKTFISTDKSLFGLKKQINKNIYESFSNFVLDSNIEEKYKLLSKYQNITSSIININISKNTSLEKMIKMIDNLKTEKIKIVSIKIYDN